MKTTISTGFSNLSTTATNCCLNSSSKKCSFSEVTEVVFSSSFSSFLIPNSSLKSWTYFSILVAAIAPSATAVTTCLNLLGLISPTANTPSTLVIKSSLVGIKPAPSISICPLNISLEGAYPTNTNTPNVSPTFALYSVISPVTLFLNLAAVGLTSPVNSINSVLNLTVIFGWAFTLSPIDLAQVKSGSLAIIVTDFPYFVKNIASSAAAKPAPITKISIPVKNSPSQVAQYATPLPVNSCSPGKPNFLGAAPVAITTLRVLYSALLVLTVFIFWVKFISTTSSWTKLTPKPCACFLVWVINSLPEISNIPG